MGSTKINPTPGVSYKNEEEAQKAELEIAQDTWKDNSVAEKATNNPNEMYGGDIQDAVHVDKTLPKVKTQIDLSGAINSDTTSALAAGKEQLGLSPEAQSIAQAYYSPIKDLSKKTEEMVKARDAAKAQDEVAQRRGRSMKMIAGISDGLASLANLIGVGQGGTNIDLGAGSLNPLSQKLEAARLERKADIKSIDDRLEQARQQMLQMQLAKGKDVAAAEERAAEASRQQARFEAEMAFRKSEAERQARQHKETLEASNTNAAEDRKLRKTQIQNDYNIRMKQLNQAAEQAGLKGKFPVLIGENEMLDIPKEKINNETIGRIFEQLPKEFKDLAQGTPQYKYENDGYGETVKTFAGYAPATLEQKLAAIGAASRDNKDIQDELRKLAGTYKPEQKTKQGTQSVVDDDDDFSSYMVKPQVTPVSMDYRDNLPGGVAIPLRR